MNWPGKDNKYLSYAIAFAVLNMFGIFFIFGARVYGDTEGYLNIIQWIWGHNANEAEIFFLRPLAPFLAAPFEFLGAGAGIIAQNIVFYLASAVLIFKIIENLFNNQKQALLGTVFFVTATPVLEVGLAYLIDMGAWFFYLLSIFLTLKFLKSRDYKLLCANGFFTGLGFLLKENGALGSVFLGMMALLSGGFSMKERILTILKFGTFFAIPIITLQIAVFHYLHYTSIDWLMGGMSATDDESLTLAAIRYAGQLFRILGLLWPLVIIGLLVELRSKSIGRLSIYLALMPSSFSFLLWTTAAGGRSVFIFAPLGIILATVGYSFLEKKILRLRNNVGYIISLAAFVMLIATNYIFVAVNQKIGFTDELVNFLKLL